MILLGLLGCASRTPRAPESTAAEAPAAAVTAADERTIHGTAWRLEDLGGAGVLDGVEATLTFTEVGHLAGNASCNSFTGPASIGAGTIRVGALASTRRACPPAVMDQETKYLRALEGARLIAMQGPYLLLYTRGMEQPLRFTRQPSGG